MAENRENKGIILRMPMLVLRGLTIFPKIKMHFDVGREKSAKALESSINDGQLIFLASQKSILDDDPNIEDVYEVGTVSRVRQILKLPGENMRVFVEGKYRARRVSVDAGEPFFMVEISKIKEISRTREEETVDAMMRSVVDDFSKYAESAPRILPEIMTEVLGISDPGYLADYIAQNIPAHVEDKQKILETINVTDRLMQLCELLERERMVSELEGAIQNRVREIVGMRHREMYLREQMKAIRAELGEDDSDTSDTQEYTDKIKKLGLEQEWEDKLLKEVSRLRNMHPSSAEYSVITTYLDTVLELPWNSSTKERLDIKKSAAILNSEHYGLEKVKERVLEFIAVRKLAPDIKGQVLCLVGPPGVGKTSIAMSLAKAMNRKISRMSLGGVRDEAEIRGHRKTYVGAMPGRIINSLRQTASKNCIILLDEIDKLGNDYRGDPASALLEVLDTEQNYAFRDHYIEIPFDLSEVMFITTANTTDTIPRPLLDRMEVIELSSYTDEEKLNIAKRHLLPKQLERHGLTRKTMRISDDALRELIACYTRESGVRTLEREIAAVCRKAAKRIASGEAKLVQVKADSLEGMIGPKKYKPERRRTTPEVGVVCGLAWTAVGGEILEAEASIVPGTGKIELTGNLGNVMKESAQAAITYIRSKATELGIDPNFYKTKDVHLHFPEGAIPKDGPSAGVTIVTAIVSALTGAPVRSDVAMTGEVTLRGRVLPIGGLKEKTMAAYRHGIHTVIVPADNESDLTEIDKTVYSALEFVLANDVGDVLRTAIDFEAVPLIRNTAPVAETAPTAPVITQVDYPSTDEHSDRKVLQ